MDQRLIQKQVQKLTLTPQLRQFLHLLQLPIFELEQKIEEELTQNPALEEVSASPESESTDESEVPEEPAPKQETPDDTLQQIESLASELEGGTWSGDASQNNPIESQKKRDYQQSILTKPSSLADYLEWELGILKLSPAQEEIAHEIIGDINSDGYLTASVEELAASLKCSTDQVEEVLLQIQTLDPPGIAARNLQENLLIQLRKETFDTSLAQRIVQNYFDPFKRKQFDQIAKGLGTNVNKINAAYEQISKLEPKPGRIFSSEEPQFVIPDAKISFDSDSEEKLIVEIRQDRIPALRINPTYLRIVRQKDTDQKTKTFLRGKIQSGLELLRAIAQRKSTLQLITEEIVRVQSLFFTKGFAYLKPLRLKDVAQTVGIHESTVSRAIQGKYMDTPQGTIPYKSFFSSKIETEEGTSESQKSTLERVKMLIANENKKKPLSDSKLVRLLGHEGIKLARRTVAKYRDILKILPAHLRKQR